MNNDDGKYKKQPFLRFLFVFALYEFYLKLFCKIVIFLYECIFYWNNKKFLSDKFELLFRFTLFP